MRILSLIFLCAIGLHAATGPAMDGKGRDLRLLAEADSVARLEGVESERARLEGKRNYGRALKLGEFPADCVVSRNRDRDCILTVNEFNQAVLLRSPDTSADPDNAGFIRKERQRILYELLHEKFLAHQLSHGEKRDSLGKRLREEEADFSMRARAKLGDSLLRKLYHESFARLFSARKERRYQVLGASDSAKLAALRRLPRDSLEGTFRWQTFSGETLDSGITGASREMEIGQISEPVRTPFGFILMRPVSEISIPAVPFEEAIPDLIDLANTPRTQNRSPNFAIYSYYQEYRSLFLSPDTAELQAWLLPDRRRKSGGFLRDIESKRRNGAFLEDTSGTRPILIDEFRLPQSVQADLEPALSHRRGEFVGPIKSDYGTWYFRTLGIRKGGRPLSLEEATPSIAREILHLDESDPLQQIQSMRASKRMSRSLSLASSYLNKRFLPDRDALAGLRDSPLRDSLELLYAGGTPEEIAAVVESALVQAAINRRMGNEKSLWLRNELSIQFIDLDP